MFKIDRILTIFIISGLVATSLGGCGGKQKPKNPTAAKTETIIESDSTDSTWEENAQIRAAIDSKDFATAKQLAESRISESPRDGRAHFLLGQAYFGEGELFKAQKSFEAAVELSPKDRNYSRELNSCFAAIADAAIAKDLPSEAIEIYKKLLSENYQPRQTEEKLATVYINTGDKLVESGNVAEAESLLRESINVVPDRPELRVKLARLLMNGDRLMESERILRALRETNPEFEAGLVAYASLLHRMGEMKQANAILSEALQIAPANPEALALQSTINLDVPVVVVEKNQTDVISVETAKDRLKTLERTGNLLEQKKLLNDVISQYPSETWAILSLSMVCEKLGQIDDALSNAEKYLVSQTDSLPGKLQLARCLYQKGDQERALLLIEEIEPAYPDKLEIISEKGQVMARMGNFAQARSLWNEILKSDPEHLATLFNYGQLEMESGNNTEAQTYFEKAIRREPFNHKFRYFAGINLIQSGLKEQAHSLWQASKNSLNSDDPYAARILRALGNDEVKNSATDLAAPPPVLAASSTPETYQVPANVIEESPVDNDYEKALEYARGGMFSEAIESFKVVISRDARNFNALMNLGKVYTATANHNLACSLYLKALKIDPKNTFALKALANAYSEVGMHTLAAQITEQVSIATPDKLDGFPRYTQANLKNNPRAFEPLAQAMIDEGLYPEASAVVQTGLLQQNELAALHLLQGDIYKQMNQFEQALESYKTALTRDPQSPAPFIKTGDLYIAAGQLTSAADQYQQALKAGFIDPDSMFIIADRLRQIGKDADAQRVLGKLKGMNLNQAQVIKLDQRLGTNVAKPKEDENQ